MHSDSDNNAPRFAQRNSKRHIFEATKNRQPQEICPKNSFHKNFHHRCHVSQEPLIQRVAQCIMCPHFQVRNPIFKRKGGEAWGGEKFHFYVDVKGFMIYIMIIKAFDKIYSIREMNYQPWYRIYFSTTKKEILKNKKSGKDVPSFLAFWWGIWIQWTKKGTFYQQKKNRQTWLWPSFPHARWRNEPCSYGTMTTLYDS